MKRVALAALVLAAFCAGCIGHGNPVVATRAGAADQLIAGAFNSRQSGIEVQDTGTVTKVLADDVEGGRHQRFILRLESGQTLLVAHNIDIAARLAPLTVGDPVEFRGQYEWNSQGGVIHWTHHDPAGRHPSGWVKCNGQTYQ